MKIPDSLPYPEIYPLEKIKEIKDVSCFIVEKYPLIGISVVIVRDNDQVYIRLADFKGNLIAPNKMGDLTSCINIIMTTYVNKIISIMRYAHIKQTQYYFVDNINPFLVDMRVSSNKLCSPGFLNDVFARAGIPSQKICGKPIVLSQENIERIRSKKGDYISGNFIIKPVVFKTIIRDELIVPLYGEVS